MEGQKYCHTCGLLLAMKKKIYAYDEETGKPKMAVEYRCLNKKWWKFGSHPITEQEAFAEGMSSFY